MDLLSYSFSSTCFQCHKNRVDNILMHGVEYYVSYRFAKIYKETSKGRKCIKKMYNFIHRSPCLSFAPNGPGGPPTCRS